MTDYIKALDARQYKSNGYGIMCGEEDALTFLYSLPVSEKRDRTIERVRYRFDQTKPVKPKFHKGHCGKKYDSYTCGHCGHGITVINNYCPNCGFVIGWDSTRCLTGVGE